MVVDGSTPPREAGFFLGCSLLDDVKPGMRVYDDEIFGPVLGVVRVPTLDDALALVNANPYGNGTAIFTRDGGSARRFEREVQVGMVGVNVPIPVPRRRTPSAGGRPPSSATPPSTAPRASGSTRGPRS